MTVTRRVSSDAPWEQAVGYSRAVAAGDFVFVTGCTSVEHGEVIHEGNPRAQTAHAIANVESALTRLGADLTDVVRTRMFVTDISRWQEIGDAHREAFGDVMPATSMVQVAALIDPRLLVEVEAVAYKPGIGGAAAADPSAGGVLDEAAGERPAAAAGLGWPG
ncbi:MAG TPA: RidA family protein [Trebonia sp.]|nr:RidA family protein [Trebonia sp.]